MSVEDDDQIRVNEDELLARYNQSSELNTFKREEIKKDNEEKKKIEETTLESST